jgi:hypothetical protein
MRLPELFLSIFIFFLIFGSFRCNDSKSVNVITEDKPFFIAEIDAEKYYINGITKKTRIYFYTSCFFSPLPCSVSIKLSNKPPDSISSSSFYSSTDWGTGGYYFKEPFPGIKEYEISTNKVKVRGSIMIPDSIAITSHNEDDTIDVVKDNTIVWSDNCSWYIIFIAAESGNRPFGYLNILTQNSFTIHPGFFPDSIYSISFSVWGYTGAAPLPGNKGNITGEGCGFIFGSNQTGDKVCVYLYLAKNGQILQGENTIKELSIEQIRKMCSDSLRNRIMGFNRFGKKW